MALAIVISILLWWRLMQCNLPILERRLDLPTSNILQDILCCSVLGLPGVDNSTVPIKLNDVRENRVTLLERTGLTEDAGIINPLKQGMPDAAVCNPERERPQRTAE